MRGTAAIVAACIFNWHVAAAAEECPGHPHAIGTSRIIAVDPTEHSRIGSMQYAETLPLKHKEVVLTFDDGPLPQYTGRILETLSNECVKATFFIVGDMARAYPDWVRKVYNAGHTVGTHSQNHPRFFWRLDDARAVDEIDEGIAATKAALGDPRALAPFFRFPGFGRTDTAERHLAARGIMTWGTDITADDWKPISPAQVIARALERLEHKGKGVLVLHDIRPGTALALPALLRELKARGYRIVHVVPAGPQRPKTVTDPAAWAARPTRSHPVWPRVLAAQPNIPAALAVPSALSFGFPDLFRARLTIAAPDPLDPSVVIQGASLALLSDPQGRHAKPIWPAAIDPVVVPPSPSAAALPVPSTQALDLGDPLGLKLMIPAQMAAGRVAATQEQRTAAGAGRRTGLPRVRHASAREPGHAPKWARMLNWFH